MAAVERGLDLIDDSPRERGGTHDGGRARGEIELRDVSAALPRRPGTGAGRREPARAPGETVALVGPSGAGKSTLVNLLPRFVDPAPAAAAGRRAAGRLGRAALRRQFALVSQDVVLFNDSVAANVALGARGHRPRTRARALRGANLLDFVDGLPQGLDTPIGHNGSQLSGGQRQRLAIARAHLQGRADPDPGRSHLGAGQRERARRAGRAGPADEGPHHAGHRAPAVDHRTRRPRGGDGRRPLVEQGTHAELLAAGGLYARLHAMQFRRQDPKENTA
jgi:ATP-binding cassette, subfamily B, bacterial MsbA